MLLSSTQKTVLYLLRCFGGMKEQMLFTLCKEPQYFGVGIYQLERLGKVKRIGEYICDENKKICSRETETALEVMIALDAHKGDYQKGVSPINIIFFKERDTMLLRYDICVVPKDREMSISAALEIIPTKSRVTVFVLEDISQRERLTVPQEHIFAVKENQNYHFYKGEKKDEN